MGELNEIGFGTGQLRHKDLNGIKKKGILSDLTEYLVQQWKWLARDESGNKENKEEKEELRISDPLWYNVKLRQPGRRGGKGLPFAPKKLNKLGIWEVGDLINEEGEVMSIREALGMGLPRSAMMEWGAVTARRSEKRDGSYNQDRRDFKRGG